MKIKNLSKRLQAIADLVGPCDRVWDIGCDHAYLSAYLLASGQVREMICTDINEGPCKRAESELKEAGVWERAQLFCCNGFGECNIRDGDVIVIAGMGAHEIVSILSQREIPASVRLVLQPNWKREVLRKHLANQGYEILEHIVLDKNFRYSLFEARYTGNKRSLSMIEAGIGEYWLEGERLKQLPLSWLDYLLRVYQSRQKKYPEYNELCQFLRVLCER